MNRDFDRIGPELERLKVKGYPPTLEGRLDAVRDLTRLIYTDIPIQGRFEYRDAFLKRLQKYIRGLYGPINEMDAAGALVFGVHLGDHLLKWFRGGRWEYHGSDPINGTDLCVRWGDESDKWELFPVKRAVKFFRNPTDDFVAVYLTLKHREAVFAALENAEPGEWVNLPDNLRVRHVDPD